MKLIGYAAWLVSLFFKCVEYLVGWPILRSAAAQVSDTELLSLAQELARPDIQNSAGVRRLWGINLIEQAMAVATEGVVSEGFRRAYAKRVPYVFVFGPK
ncbi:hypothetical protein VQ574_20970 (plasmid) [Stutzerimonas frequens]|uniref:hypothetical protein n=1 Tax=Stutzerimonas frequens TaxID=2968969 RepID=UPI002DB5D4C1|nr:hypothetical protein [Stutzerimonas frequens]WRW29411.1 hypothetical protein VQ574_20970 [Stutzerimonas frequens]